MLLKNMKECFIVIFIISVCIFSLFPHYAHSAELKIKEINPIVSIKPIVTKQGQIPHSQIAFGKNDIKAAWFAGATDRYGHGILGDTTEASKLLVETIEGKTLRFTLTNTRVFEDLVPRVIDLNNDLNDEVLVIESDMSLGASLSVYRVESDQLVHITSTPFIGRPNRWLNPVGAGDFDGDGALDVALIVTPHIGGILRLYRFIDSKLVLFAERSGVSNHRIGSTELGIGTVVNQNTKDLLVLPDQSHRELILLKWTNNGLRDLSRIKLPSPVSSSFKQAGSNRWHFQLQNNKFYELRLEE